MRYLLEICANRLADLHAQYTSYLAGHSTCTLRVTCTYSNVPVLTRVPPGSTPTMLTCRLLVAPRSYFLECIYSCGYRLKNVFAGHLAGRWRPSSHRF